jgi:hypothetical protein
MNLLAMLISNFRGSVLAPHPILPRDPQTLSRGVLPVPTAWNQESSASPTRLVALEGCVVGLESYAGKLRAVWLEHHIICIDKASQGVSSLRFNRPVQLMVLKQGSGWVLRQAIALPLQPTLVELEPLETPPLVGFVPETITEQTHFSHA